MTQEEIIQGNKIIAEFMGYTYQEEDVCYENESGVPVDTTIYSKVPIGIVVYEGDKFFKDLPNPDYNAEQPVMWNSSIKELRWDVLNYGNYLTELNYDKSWDWLMPVVEKIEMLHDGVFSFFIVQGECDIALSFPYKENGEDWYAPKFAQKKGDKLLSTWCAAVNFIKWYNSENGNQ